MLMQSDDASSDTYEGYFRGPGGEFRFTLDYETRRAWLTTSDSDWSDRHPVIDGGCPTFPLFLEEAVWLQACWHVARERIINEAITDS